MAIFTSGRNQRLQMDDIDFLALITGTAVTTATSVRVAIGPNETAEFRGTFTLDAAGNVTGGRLTAVEHRIGNDLVFSITDLSMDYTSFIAGVRGGGRYEAIYLLLNGNDTIVGAQQGQTLIGSGGNDTIIAGDFGGPDNGNMVFGGGGNDILIGGSRGDNLYGDEGNDRLRGGGGFDFIFGGAGIDTAEYIGLRREYTVTTSRVGGGPEAGLNGAFDTLGSIERIAFVDGIIDYDPNGTAAQVMRLYDSALDRLPDQAGLAVQVRALDNGSSSLTALANAFVASPEFQARYGALSDRQFVEQLYRFCLNREGDAAGIAVQVQALQSGVSRGQLLIGFSESAEHRNLTASVVTAGLWIEDAEALQIARLYDATFDRLPDPPGLAAQVAALDAGTALLTIAAGFAASPEFQARYGTLSNQAFVEQLYRFCLDREGDAPGIAAQVSALNAGTSRAQLLLNFSESPEHVALTAASWQGGIRFPGAARAIEEPGKDDGPQVLITPDLLDDFGTSSDIVPVLGTSGRAADDAEAWPMFDPHRVDPADHLFG